MPTDGPVAVAHLDPVAVRAQVDRVLASDHFKNTRRCRSMLQYVAEESLEGRSEHLKERTIGASVFGREPQYDTTQDPVVRNVAIEVRKRLAQYYMEPAHENEIRIELPHGSYVPEFLASSPSIVPPNPGPSASVVRRPRRLRWVAAGLLVVAAAGLSARAIAIKFRSPFESFWATLLADQEIVQICVGEPHRLYSFAGPHGNEYQQRMLDLGSRQDESAQNELKRTALSLAEIAPTSKNYLYKRDALCMTRVAALLESRGRRYRLRSVGDAPYGELRRSPLVVIGAFNNEWTLRFTNEARFGFAQAEENGRTFKYISDRQQPAKQRWKIFADELKTSDYAIVTRVVATATERTVVSLAGLYDYGTQAAGEFVTDPAYLNTALRNTPAQWRNRNLQIVLQTQIIGATAGPPAVVALYSW